MYHYLKTILNVDEHIQLFNYKINFNQKLEKYFLPSNVDSPSPNGNCE
jgi:hypothetical protein